MSGLLLTRGIGVSDLSTTCYVADTEGNFVTSYNMPGGSLPFGSDKMRTQVGSPDGTVWIGVKTVAGVGAFRQVRPATGEIMATVLPATFTDMVPGYTLTLMPRGQFLAGGIIGGANTLCLVNADGTLAKTYSLPSDTVGCFALAHDATTLYYVVKNTTVINRWDLTSDTALPTYGDFDAHGVVGFQGQFILTADDQVIALYTTVSHLMNLRLLHADLSTAVRYIPSNAGGTDTTLGGMAFDLSANRVYMSMPSATHAGTVMAFSATDGSAPIWSTDVALDPSTNDVFGQVVLTPPQGSPRAYPATTTTEPIYRLRQGPWLTQRQLMQFFQKFQLVIQAGGVPADHVAAQVAVQWTNDGHTWSPLEWVDYGAAGDFSFRVQQYQMGQDRNRAYRVLMTSSVPVVWLEALIQVETGIS